MIRALGGCLLCAAATAGCSTSTPRPSPPNVLLVTIDTFRADRLGTGVAPALDRLAAASVRFNAARTAAPLTLPSHTTILTGVLPPQHGVRENGVDSLDDTHPTIGTLLKSAGYGTAAFVGAFVLDRRFGLARGFDTYDDQIPRDPQASEALEAERPASVVIDRAIGWLDSWDHGPGTTDGPRTKDGPSPKPQAPRPFFVWIHLYDPHAPYAPPPEFRGRTKSAYDDEVAYADAQVARVLDWLRSHSLLERTLIVVAGDHGEGLGDHGERTHGMLLFDSTLRVPLVVSAPGARASQRNEAVSLVDVAPTVLRAAGVEVPSGMQGHDLLHEVEPKADASDVRNGRRQLNLYSESEYPRVAGWSPLQALTDGRWKTIRWGSGSQVFDLQSDPNEQHDLATAQPNVAMAMTTRIGEIRGAAAPAGARTISPEAEQRLRSLGYVASASQAPDNSTAPNPATRIGEWNDFENALGLSNAHDKAAVAAFDALAKRNPDAMVIQTSFARALKDAGRFDRALAVYREAAKRWATDATVLHDLAVAARDAAGRASGKAAASLLDEANRAEQAAATVAPTSAMAHNGLGLLAVDANRPHDAAREFQRAAELDPNNAAYWANLGNAHRATGDRSGAEQAFRRALDVDPRTADAANGLGVLLVEAQRPADAVPWLERAAAAAPDFVEARLNLGIALQQSGQTARAAEIYRSVLAAPPSYAREREAAAKLLASLGAGR